MFFFSFPFLTFSFFFPFLIFSFCSFRFVNFSFRFFFCIFSFLSYLFLFLFYIHIVFAVISFRICLHCLVFYFINFCSVSFSDLTLCFILSVFQFYFWSSHVCVCQRLSGREICFRGREPAVKLISRSIKWKVFVKVFSPAGKQQEMEMSMEVKFGSSLKNVGQMYVSKDRARKK